MTCSCGGCPGSLNPTVPRVAEAVDHRPTVYLHIGAPKTGATYLQRVLWHNREELARDGVCYAAVDPEEHFRAAVDLRALPWGNQEHPEYAGAWQAVADRATAWPGRSVISNELLAAATTPQIHRVVDSLAGAEVHVVYTLRDLARMLPSDWQEQVKHRHALSWEEYLHDVIDAGGDSELGAWFWGLHNGPAVLARWADVVTPARVHLIIGPPASAPADRLWERFAAVLGLDPGGYDVAVEPMNISLGRAQTELLQRVNARVAGTAIDQRYHELVGAVLVDGILRQHGDPTPVRLPGDRLAWLTKRSEQVVAALASSGYDVTGELDELLPEPELLDPAPTAPMPADIALDVSADVVVALLLGHVGERSDETSEAGVAAPQDGAAEALPAAGGHGGQRPAGATATRPRRAGPARHRPRVYLHVGGPKTGTTFLQAVLFRYRNELERDGLLYPADRYDDHFFAAVDLQSLAFYGEPRPEAAGAWQRVAKWAKSAAHHAVISHDVLAAASREHAQAAIDSLAPAEVHIVYTARDLARQLPSQWQEDVKHGIDVDFEPWLDQVLGREDDSRIASWFWSIQDVPGVLDRWGSTLPPERVHLVTVASSGGDRAQLWRRFAGVLGVDPGRYDVSEVPWTNQGLGVAQVELMRRVSRALAGRFSQTEYEHAVKGALAHETLVAQGDQRRVHLDRKHLQAVTALTQQWVSELAHRGYDVVGDLDDLAVRPDTDSPQSEEPASEREVATVAVAALAELLTRTHRERRDRAALEARLRASEAQPEPAVTTPPGDRAKRTAAETAWTGAASERLVHLYRRVWGRHPH